MARTRLGLFDPETEYVQKLGAYIMLNERDSLEAHIYTDVEKLLLNLEALDVILVSEDFSEIASDTRVVRLVERKNILLEKQVLKYQKVSSLLGEVKRLFSIDEVQVKENKGKILCVESPSRHELQMLYSMCLCKELSINEKVLYINLCGNSGFLSLFQNGEEKNLEDLFSEAVEEDFSLEGYIQKDQGVSFIAPSRRPELLWEVDTDVFWAFVNAIENSPFEIVVIDIENFFPEYYRLIDKCEELILLRKEGFLSEYCKREYLDNLKLHLGEECLEKVKDVILPLNSVGIWESQFLLDDLFRGNLGDFVRKGLEKNERSCRENKASNYGEYGS